MILKLYGNGFYRSQKNCVFCAGQKNKISIPNTSGNLQPSFDYNFPILELY